MSDSARAEGHSAHLVGSVNPPAADDVFAAAADALGDALPRIPDGEVGERFSWLQFQTFRFDRTRAWSAWKTPRT